MRTDRELLKRVIERWDELQDRDCTKHDWECLLQDVRTQIEERNHDGTPLFPVTEEGGVVTVEQAWDRGYIAGAGSVD